MNITLSDRVNAVKPSPTLAITARAARLRASGKDIISLGAGEPDFDTPEHIKRAAIKALAEGFTKYTPVDGTPSLKKTIIKKFETDNGLHYEDDQILVSCGGKQSFFNLTQALLNPGDEVIILGPYWVSYPDMILLAQGKPVIITATQDQQFKINPEQLRAALTRNTRLFVINSPSNPTGVTYTIAELKALADVLNDYPNVIIATDDMYEHITWETGRFVNILNAAPELYNRTVVLNGVSKAYSMTGWRIGYAGGPKEIIQAMKKIQSQSTSNPTSISQVAAEAAISGNQDCMQTRLFEFKKRHDYVVKKLNQIPGIDCLATDGTFYVFPDVSNAIARLKNIENDIDFAEHLITHAGVAVVPGSAFGCSNHIRISIATSMENLENAIKRIGLAL
ncbi:MAG: pyridoxal phosphate-dependent aminotransferase [Methylococcales bacterium]|jgi:aspartate aminotransferase|nr:pyridoxal phosphate-dependent aminotransferase [Methylococcales bacterium]MBT3506916.1 pyridoxal phosphate-dependent aminotransferase [Methylococcales bacterium]MBT3698632.1 pyridoxal phosphate-dependent aminotransferase [Methylococcales bacterium]MBT3815975.1 pyridoxal phosphate-dependent aminotransferase [Methylococcales bacterium]MBT4032656.1 pyridoxal phosphate-dependent aminotransferase [Methylococcales bacterium]